MRLDYIKKPVIVQAVQFTGNNYDEICDFVGETLDTQTDSQNNIVSIFMYTRKKRMIANIGDYVIKYTEGGSDYVIKYTEVGILFCEPNRFNMMYELASN